MNKKEFENIYAFHPGYYINDLINDMEITQDEFAKRLNISSKNLSDLINGKASISDKIAKNLSLMFGTSVETWVNLQKKYDEKVIEIKKLQAQRDEEKDLSLIDYSFFEKLGVVEPSKDKAKQVVELLRYLSVSSFSVLKKRDFLVQFRQTNNIDEKTILNANAWVQTIINFGREIKTKPYYAKKLKGYLPQIREMTMKSPSDFLPQLHQILSECGIAFVLIPSLKKSGVYGATKWLGKNKAVVGITNRGKYADIFWFSFLHELGHVFQRKITKIIVDFEADSYNEAFENEANQFAQDLLIPPDEYNIFSKEKTFSEAKVRDFANSVRIHPGIVVGRLQKDNLIPYTHLNKLRLKYVF
jgi:HTH-type transcriptional regulator/antitoxin HigA